MARPALPELDPSSLPNRRGVCLILAVISAVWLIGLLLYGPELARLSLRQMAVVLLISEIVLATLVCRSDPRGTWGFPFLYLLVLMIFHSGLFLSPALLGRLPDSLQAPGSVWFTDGVAVRAAYIVCVAIACYSLGYAILRLLPAGTAAHVEEVDTAGRLSLRDGMVDVGAGLTAVSVLTWFVISFSNSGSLFFLGSYLTYLDRTNTAPLPWVYLGISLGVTLSALDVRRASAKVGLAAFGIFAVPAFLIGLRGEVLFPAVAVVGVLGSGRRLWRSRVFWLVSAAALIAISFVGQARVQGLADSSDVASSPVSAIEEMGYSIRPLATSVRWHEYAHESYLHGATYVAPVDRQIRGVLGLPVPRAQDDDRLMNVEISQRQGAIGGSVIAEAHHNGGLLGVIAIMTLLGALVGLIFRHPKSALRVALSGIVAVLLLMHVRNSFAPLPAWGAVGVAIIVLGFLLTMLRSTPSWRLRAPGLRPKPVVPPGTRSA